MKAEHPSDNAPGFWARLKGALAAMEMSSMDLLELRIQRLENEVARLGGRDERKG